MYPTDIPAQTVQDKCLRDYLHRMLYQATFYPAEEGWNALARIGLNDLLLRREEFESNMTSEVMIGEGYYHTDDIAAHCKNFFRLQGQDLAATFHEKDPCGKSSLEHVVMHPQCTCHVFMVSDGLTETLCTITRMNQSGIFYVITNTFTFQDDTV